MAEVNLHSWSEISQASEGLQLNSTTATLEHILARFARIETRLVEHERRVAATLPPLQPEPDPPWLYAASQPQFQSTCHQPYADHGYGTPTSAATMQYQIAWTGYQQNCPPPRTAYPTVQITPPYQTDKYQQLSTYRPSQPLQPQCSTFGDPPTCWEIPGQRPFLGSSAYDQLPYHSNALPQNPFVGYPTGQLEYQPPEPSYQPLQPWLHLDHSLQQPSLAQPDAAFGLPSYAALDTYAAPSSYVLLKNSSRDGLECAQKESLIVNYDRVGEEFNDSIEKFVHSSGRFCGFEKVDIDGNSKAREDDGAKERKIVEEDAVPTQHLECFLDSDGHTLVPIELVESLAGKHLDEGNDRIDDNGENQDRDRVDERESLVPDVDIIEEPIYTMLEVMDVTDKTNSGEEVPSNMVISNGRDDAIISHHSTMLDADARLIPPRSDTPCLGIHGRVDQPPVLALNSHKHDLWAGQVEEVGEVLQAHESTIYQSSIEPRSRTTRQKTVLSTPGQSESVIQRRKAAKVDGSLRQVYGTGRSSRFAEKGAKLLHGVNLFFKKNLVINVVQNFKRNLEESLDEALEDSIHISTKFLEMENSYSSMKSLQYNIFVDVALGVKLNCEVGFKNLKVVGLQLGDVAILDISAAPIEQDELTTPSIRSNESRFQFDQGDKYLSCEKVAGVFVAQEEEEKSMLQKITLQMVIMESSGFEENHKFQKDGVGDGLQDSYVSYHYTFDPGGDYLPKLRLSTLLVASWLPP